MLHWYLEGSPFRIAIQDEAPTPPDRLFCGYKSGLLSCSFRGYASRMLALAYRIDDLVERGVLKSYAEAAAKLGLTRARVSQVLQLMNLCSRIQEEILMGSIALPERRLRSIAAIPDWAEQWARWRE